jgi:MFS-type transporter involved in bile tolerance (Atg22 family)
MALSKVNYNSMNVTPAASKAIKFNSSNNGLETGDIGGNLVLLATQTASSNATLSFTSGYRFYL